MIHLPQLHAVCDRNIPFKTLIFTHKIIPFPHFFSILFTSWRYPPSVSLLCWNLRYLLTSAAYYWHHGAASSNVNYLFVNFVFMVLCIVTINKIQRDATLHRCLFTAKLLYMFRVSIAPINHQEYIKLWLQLLEQVIVTEQQPTASVA